MSQNILTKKIIISNNTALALAFLPIMIFFIEMTFLASFLNHTDGSYYHLIYSSLIVIIYAFALFPLMLAQSFENWSVKQTGWAFSMWIAWFILLIASAHLLNFGMMSIVAIPVGGILICAVFFIYWLIYLLRSYKLFKINNDSSFFLLLLLSPWISAAISIPFIYFLPFAINLIKH